MNKNQLDQNGQGNRHGQREKLTINNQGNYGKEGRTNTNSNEQNQADSEKDKREDALNELNHTNFSIHIKAPCEKVWDILWNDATYRQWTAVFHEGSHAVSDWKEGSKVQFLTPDGSGMYSTIIQNTPNERMSFKHIGEIKKGEEQKPDESWTGAMETYLLHEMDGATELRVELEGIEEYQDYFNKTFPKALDKVKELAEK